MRRRVKPQTEDSPKFLVLGCHHGRSEKPFVYDIRKNKYVPFADEELYIDLYRSNEVVQDGRSSAYIRPFVKVGERASHVQVQQYFLEDTTIPIPQEGKQVQRRTLA